MKALNKVTVDVVKNTEILDMIVPKKETTFLEMLESLFSTQKTFYLSSQNKVLQNSLLSL